MSTEQEALTNTDAGAPPPDMGDVPRETPDAGDQYETDARKVGWREKDEFVAKGGRESDWVPADQFLTKRAELTSARAAENRKLEKKLAARDAEIDAIRRENAEIKAALAEQAKSRTEITEQSLMAQRRAAMQSGDEAEFDRLDSELWKFRNRPAPPPPQAQSLDPRIKVMLEEFAEENPIYQRPEMQEILALGVKAVREINPNMPIPESLRKGHDYARRLYSDHYITQNGARKAPAMAETGGTPARSGPAEKSWSDLKPEVRAGLDAFLKDSPTHAKMKPAELDAARKRMVADMTPDQFKGR